MTVGLALAEWYRFGGWMVVALDAERCWWAYLDVTGHPTDPEVWRGTILAGDEPEDWAPTGIALSAFLAGLVSTS